MKPYNKLAFFSMIFAVFVAMGCSKFLDHPLENQTQVTTINYTDLSLMYQPVSGAYRAVTRGGYLSWVTTFIKTSQSDDIDPRTGYSEVNDLINKFKSGAVLQNFWGLNEMWSNYYGAIITCNGALAELDKFGKNIQAGDAINTKRLAAYQAETRFLIALGHYFMSRSFGDVPILGPESIQPAYLDTVHKTKVDDVRKYVISEMDYCIANLEDARPNEVAAPRQGAATKYTALMLKAKAAMDLAGNDDGSPYWDVVLDATNQIIASNKFSLFPDYYRLWKKPGKLCNESIFEFQYSDFGQSSGDIVTSGNLGSEWANFFLFQGPENTFSNVITGPGWLVPTDRVVSFLKNRSDAVRLETTILNCGVNGQVGTVAVTPDGDKISGNVSGKKYFNGKVYYPESDMTPGRVDFYGAGNNIRVFRYADVLLMNAEAKIRKGQNGDGPLNLVRNRVGLTSVNGATIQQVLDERHAEFICEWWGERFNDLVRTDQAAAILGSLGFVKGQSEFFPTPQTQIDRNQNLK